MTAAVKIANFIINEVLHDISVNGLNVTFPVTAAQIANIIKLVDANIISNRQAKELYKKFCEDNKLKTTLK